MSSKGTAHKEALPSQKTLKRRRTEPDVKEGVESEQVKVKENEIPNKNKTEDIETCSSSDEDDDLAEEQSRLEALRNSQPSNSSARADGLPSSNQSDFDVLFHGTRRRSTVKEGIQNSKEKSTNYNRFLKNMFK